MRYDGEEVKQPPSLPATATPATSARRITAFSIALSFLLAIPLLVVHIVHHSQLALAQAADSVTDAVTAAAFLYSLRVAVLPADANHPRGHHRAEPIAALLAAVLAGVLAVEVFREAMRAIGGDVIPRMEWSLAAVFTVKLAAKTGLSFTARHHQRTVSSPALRVLEVDARNDVLVGLVALVGFFGARYGSPGWDAWLALPLACWIAASGVGLARENIRLLMGEAPPRDRQKQLLRIAREVPGVESTHDLSARYDGTQLDVSLHIVVDENLSLRRAHDIAETVEARLMAEPDVLIAMVHVDVEADAPRGSSPAPGASEA